MTFRSCSPPPKAERVEGGYRFTGRKHFGSLTPVWTYLGIHGMDMSDPAHPMIIHAFIPRETEGLKVVDTWDVLGMRATRSDDTILDGALRSRPIHQPEGCSRSGGARPVRAGPSSPGRSWASAASTTVWLGAPSISPVETVKKKTSIGLSRPMSYHAGVQHGVAEMVLELEAIGPHLDARGGGLVGRGELRRGLGDQDHLRPSIMRSRARGGWWIGPSIWPVGSGSSVRDRSSGCCATRDWAGFTRRTRCSPTSCAAKLTLGISPDEGPRWG